MTQEQKNANRTPEQISDEQMEKVAGGAGGLTEWKKRAIDSGEQRGISIDGYTCHVCGTVGSTFASSKIQNDYHDCKCYNCGCQVYKISITDDGPINVILKPPTLR